MRRLAAQAGGPPNYALNGTATQSTMDWGGVPENGINGNLGDFTHTAADDPNMWWEVDLGEDFELKEIVVYNRASCCGERLDGAVVKALDADRNEIFVSDPIAGAATADVHVFDNAGAGFAAVRYIRLEGGTDFLSLGEVQAFPYWPFAYDPDPADGAVDVDTAQVQWIPADAAAAHNVYLGTDPNAMDLVAEGDGAASQAAVTLEPGLTYFWRVDAIDADGVVSEGDVWSFDTLPLEAHFPSPYDGKGNVLDGAQLSWTAGKGVLLHNVYFGTDPEALTPTMYLSETSLDPGPLEIGTTYYWRVDEFTGIVTNEGPLWSFTTVPVLDEVVDPNLLIYYNFESGAHTTVLDQSGHGNHALFMRTPEWATGIAGGCLAIESSDGDYIETAVPLGIVSNTVTVTGWVKHEATPAAWSGILTHRRPDGNLGLQQDGNELRYMWGADSYWWVSSGLKIPNGEWYFAALAVAPDQAKLYLDGVGATYTNVDVHIPVTFDSGIRVARDHSDDRIMTCLIDEVRLYDTTLTDEEILAVMVLDPAQAQAPTPGNRTTLDPEDAMSLSWVAGEGAMMHFVYLGTDADQVAASDPNILLGTTNETSMDLAEPLVRGTTYYWQVEEMAADATVTPGRVWSFTLTDVNTDSWATAVAVAEPNFVATQVEAGVYDVGALGGEITYEFVVRANPDEEEVSMALIGRIGFGDTTAALKYEQWNNTGNYGATHFGVMDYDFGVANAPGEYTHLVFVSSEDAGTTALYVNGAYQASVDGPITLSGIVGIGYATRDEEGSAFIDPFDGDIFGVAIYSGALSDDEIQAHAIAYFYPAFAEDFEAYAAGSDLHGQGGWKGWDNTASAGAPASDALASGGLNSVEIVGSADLVHEFDFAGGVWELSVMQYIPSGTTGTTYFILLNSYDDGANQDWSIQTTFDLAAGTIGYWHGGDAAIVYDEWVELRYVIDLDNNTVDKYYNGEFIVTDLDNNTVDKYYNGEFIVTDQWDDNDHGTLGAVDLFGNGASSIYYDDLVVAPYAEMAGPVGHWTLDDGAGTIAHDSSGNGNEPA